jgi:cytochrome b subunit of formate dehydrogenase
VRALLGYKPHQHGKYLATEQTLSYPPWAILIGLITVTGLIKVLRYTIEIPGALVAVTTTVHDVTALIIGVMLVIHLLPLLLVPANWPLLLSMFKTTVSRKYVEERHPVWYAQLRTQKPAEAVGEAGAERRTAQTARLPSGD